MIDYHIHSEFSSDAEHTLDQICQAALKGGINEIAVCDHLDLDYPVDEVMYFDFEERGRAIRQVRNKYPDLIIREGIEIGLMESTKQDYVNIIKRYDFDFILNSIHVVDGMDPYYGDYFQTRSIKAGIREYLEAILGSITGFNAYSVIGHIGYFARYTGEEKRPIQYAEYPELFDELLKTVIKNDKGIEINTKGVTFTGETLPPRSILQRYYELGGEIITVGSDAHIISRVGDGIDDAVKMLKEIGFKAITRFEKLKPIQYDI